MKEKNKNFLIVFLALASIVLLVFLILSVSSNKLSENTVTEKSQEQIAALNNQLQEYQTADESDSIEKENVCTNFLKTYYSVQHSKSKAAALPNCKAYLTDQLYSKLSPAEEETEYSQNNVDVDYTSSISIKEGKPTFCSKRGTNTYKKFMWEDPANDYNHCFFIDNGSDTLVVNEAMIDTMSVMSIMEDCGRQLNDYSYVNLSGTPKWESVTTILKENPLIKNVILACDNDNAGFTAMNNIRKNISENFPNVKTTDFLPKTENDWNAQLQFIRQHSISTSIYLKSSPEHLVAMAQGNHQSIHVFNRNNILEFEKVGGGF